MTSIDFFVAIVMILSILLAVLRGFTREVLTIVAFVGAVLAVIYGLPVLGPLFQHFFKDETTAKIAAGITLGLVTLVVLSLISHRIAKGVNKVGLGLVDRTLGVVFGVARAAVILCIFYIGVIWFSGGKQPGWLAEGKSIPLIAQGSEKLVSYLPPSVQDTIKPEDSKKDKLLDDADKASHDAAGKIDDATAKAVDKVDDVKDKAEKPPAPPEKPAEKPAENGYGKSDRGGLDKLIEDDRKSAKDGKKAQ